MSISALKRRIERLEAVRRQNKSGAVPVFNIALSCEDDCEADPWCVEYQDQAYLQRPGESLEDLQARAREGAIAGHPRGEALFLIAHRHQEDQSAGIHGGKLS